MRVEGQIVALRRVAQGEAGTAAEGRYGETALVGGVEDSTYLVDGVGRDGGRGHDSVNRVAILVSKPLSPKGPCHGLSGWTVWDGHLRQEGGYM